MIELPKDAEGREIPLDTKVLYRKDGTLVDVDEFNFSTGYSDPKHKWTVKLMNCAVFFTTKMFLNPPEPPDSWEKLEEDLGRASKRDAVVSCCRYFTADKCANCPIHGNASCCLHKEELAFGDILDRIRKLRSEGDD